MPPDPFGDFRRDGKAGGWLGHPELPRFAALGARAAEPESGPEDPDVAPRLSAEIQELHGRYLEPMRSRLGPAAAPVFQALEEQRARLLAEATRTTSPAQAAEQAAEAARHAAETATEAKRLRDGRFPVRVITPRKAGPAPEQAAAFRHLIDHEADVCRAVLAALHESYQEYSKDERWREICDLPAIAAPEGLTAAAHLSDVDVMRERRDGVAFLVFNVDCDWEVEHGMYVVYHPATGAAWTTYDGLDDLLNPGGPAATAEPAELPGHILLDYAVLADDQAKVRELIAQGHAINDQSGGPFAPLVPTVERLDVALLGRLLAAGADPNSRDFGGRTALERARELHREYTRRADAPPAESGDALMKAAMSFSGQVYRRDLPKVEEIIRLLEAAGAV